MKKILLVSDTHGNTDNFEKLLTQGPWDAVLHMGDAVGQEDLMRAMASPVPMDIVAGNCDLFSYEQDRLILKFENVTVFMSHGHFLGARHGVNTENAQYYLSPMADAAKNAGAQVALFGHTHEPLVDYVGGVLMANPGSLSRPRQMSGKPTYGIMTVDGDKVRVEIKTIF